MPRPIAEKIIDQARYGKKPTSDERRMALVYLMYTQSHDDIKNTEMAELFQVSERQIRKDRAAIRKKKSEYIKTEDVSLVIADIAINTDRQIYDLEKSKGKCKLGTKNYLDHCKAIVELEQKKIKLMQDLGYYPKNLGTLVEQKFEFKSTITRDTSMLERPLNMEFEGGEDLSGREVLQIAAPDFIEVDDDEDDEIEDGDFEDVSEAPRDIDKDPTESQP